MIKHPKFHAPSNTLLLTLLGILVPFLGSCAPEGKPDTTNKRAVFLLGEHEYGTPESLPMFGKSHLEPLGIECSYIQAQSDDRDSPLCHEFDGLDKITEADILILSTRRRYPKSKDMAAIRAFITSGKPVIAIRTASHAFGARKKGKGYQAPEGHSTWDSFDVEILGASYQGHYPEKEGKPPLAVNAWIEKSALDHPIVANLKTSDPLLVGNKLYKYINTDPEIKILLSARFKEGEQAHPIAWTNEQKGMQIFYTSLGGKEEMAQAWVQHLLKDAVVWGLNKK